ncbi:MAG: hypothetical protein ABFD69_05165 [Candidatus Sumerlaeia bacterium]
MDFRTVFIILALAVIEMAAPLNAGCSGETLARSFELRWVSDQPAANGETDFKGPTAIHNTDERIHFLNAYDQVAARFFNNPNWDRLAVDEARVAEATRRIKPQPLPAVRRRIPLTDWKFTGQRRGQRRERARRLDAWNALPDADVRDGALVLTRAGGSIQADWAAQDWRFRFQWSARLTNPGDHALFTLVPGVICGLRPDGSAFYRADNKDIAAGSWQPGSWARFVTEVDLSQGRFNLYLNDALIADFVPLADTAAINRFVASGSAGLELDDIWGQGYQPLTKDPRKPFSIATFIDEDFSPLPDLGGWNRAGYDDAAWVPVPHWPYAHGGERRAGEDLYLRTTVRPGRFQKALLNVECLDPAGDIWVNGRHVESRNDRYPFELDLTQYLKPNEENLIAVRVKANKETTGMVHTPTDDHTGWSAGRMALDLTTPTHIDDVFVHTERLDSNEARVCVETTLAGTDARKLKVSLYPWFPAESAAAAATEVFTIEPGSAKSKNIIRVNRPALWSPEHPRLYKVSVSLLDDQGNPIDDEVVTAGIRTVSQEGGTFRINGRPAMMNGTLIFGFRPPLERISQWVRCPPEDWIVREILMIQAMNGNTIRMSQHNSVVGGVNDPRYAEIGDQLGIMFQWATTSWVREYSPDQLDFKGLPLYVRQVRNHPSIVIWQPANHPGFPKGDAGFREGMKWYGRVYETIYALDQSRLITPTANVTRLHPRNDAGTLDCDGNAVEPIPAWTAPGIARGDMDHATGYGAEWIVPRLYPSPPTFTSHMGWRDKGYKQDFLNSPVRAYFDFESEESAGQPNWNLVKGKPEYLVFSYEHDYDTGSIGQLLNSSQWRASQAWQAMSAYEAYRKKRWLDYDGLAWCTLRGGGNTATYQKPLTDYYNHTKMAFHAVGMVFQPILAGSRNVDMVYGPGDAVPVVLMNLGEERMVDVIVTVRDLDGRQIEQKIFSGVRMPAGRSATDVGEFKPGSPKGIYSIEYEVRASND